MATVKELQAKFTSSASGMESAFTTMANKLNDIEKASDRAATSMEKNMSRGMNRVFKTGEGFKRVSGTLETISKKSVEMGDNLTKKITKPAMIAGGALASITIGKGFGRLVEIDNAQAKLDGLGHSGKDVKGIMNNALESVKGTSFGLGEAATTASSAVAAGIEPGKELTRYLSLTGDAAAIAGTSMGEMGSIINKVQTSNKAYNGELQQLSERGIPIYQWIAKEANVTADAVFDMARDGEISSEMFLNAIETNIGGAAKKMGEKSFTAGLANMWAAVGRLGASFLDAGGKGGGFFSKMKPLMAEFTNSLDGMESTAAKWGESLGIAFDKIVEGIRGIIGWYNSLDKNTQKLINSVMKWSALTLVAVGPILKIFGRLTGVIAAVFGPFGKFLQFIAKFSTASKSAEGAIAGITKVFPKLGSALGLITGPVGWITLGIIALGTAFVVAYKKSETFRDIVNKVVEGVKNAFGTLAQVIKGFFQLFKGNGQDGIITLSKILPPNVVQGLTIFVDSVKANFFKMVEAIKQFATVIGNEIKQFWSENGAQITEAVKNVGSIISTVFNFIWGNVIKPIMTLIWNLMKLLWPAIKFLIISTWENIKGVIKGALNVIMGLIKVFSGLFTGDFKKMWEGIKQVFVGAVQLLWNLIQLYFVGKILGVARGFIGLFKGAFVGLWNFIKSLFTRSLSAIVNGVRTAFTNTLNITKIIYTSMNKFLVWIWTMIKNFVVKMATNIWLGVRNRFTNLLKSIRSIFNNVRNFLVQLWTNVKNRIVDLAQAIWSNVRAKFMALFNSIKTIFTSVRKFLVNLWTNLKNRIVNIAQLIWTSVKNKFIGLWNSIKYIFNTIRNFSVNLWNSLKNKVISIVQNLWNGVKNRFTGLWNSIKNILTRTFEFSKNIWNNIKDKAVSMATTMKNSVVDTFKRMRDGIKGFVGGIKDMVIGMKDSVVDNAKKLAEGIKKHAIGGLNLMIKGVNLVGDKLGLGKEMIKPIKLSTGTRNGAIASDTMAVVGDKGRGNGPNGFRHETIRYPNGKTVITPDTDTLAYLPKGTVVDNGQQTYASMNGLPRFADGTGLFSSIAKKTGAFLGKKAGENPDKVKKVSDGVEGVKNTGKAVKDKFDSVIGDVFDYIENPGKLVNKVMDMMGVDFSAIKAIPGQMMGSMYKKLTNGVKNLFTKWFDETSGGDIDGTGILSKGVTYGYSPDKPLPGYPLSINGGRHYGIDTPHIFEKIQAPMSGKATKQHDVGGGNILRLAAGKIAMYFVHLSKILKEGMVKKGEDIAVTGNSGAFTTGAHLHTQVEKGPTPYLTNTNTLDPVKVLKGMGGNTKGGNFKGTIVKALKAAGLPTTAAYINAWSKQIMTESGGNPNAIGGTDGYSHGRATGLVQVKPTTFQAMKGKGMNDIMNPLHNLVAGMNWSKYAYGSNILDYIGKGHGYAKGGIVNSPQMAWLAEGGFSESVISHDPSMKARSKVLYDKTGDMLGFNEDTELLREIIEQISVGNQLQSVNNRDTNRIANKDSNVYLDGKEITKSVSSKQGNMARNVGYNLGLGGV